MLGLQTLPMTFIVNFDLTFALTSASVATSFSCALVSLVLVSVSVDSDRSSLDFSDSSWLLDCKSEIKQDASYNQSTLAREQNISSRMYKVLWYSKTSKHHSTLFLSLDFIFVDAFIFFCLGVIFLGKRMVNIFIYLYIYLLLLLFFFFFFFLGGGVFHSVSSISVIFSLFLFWGEGCIVSGTVWSVICYTLLLCFVEVCLSMLWFCLCYVCFVCFGCMVFFLSIFNTHLLKLFVELFCLLMMLLWLCLLTSLQVCHLLLGVILQEYECDD